MYILKTQYIGDILVYKYTLVQTGNNFLIKVSKYLTKRKTSPNLNPITYFLLILLLRLFSLHFPSGSIKAAWMSFNSQTSHNSFFAKSRNATSFAEEKNIGM